MKISLSVLSVLSTAGVSLGASLGRSVPVISEYEKLFQLCENGGSNAYVGVQYQGDVLKTFNYNECYPYEIDGKLAEMAVFCKSVTCYSNPNPDCTGGAVPPVPVPVAAGLTLVNVADFVQMLGQGATCQPNALP